MWATSLWPCLVAPSTISLQGGALQGEGLFPDSERPGATIPRHLFKQAVARKTRTLE